MTRTLKKRVPDVALLGQTLEFLLRFDGFSPSTDTATFNIRTSTGRLDLAATDNGDGFFKFYVDALAVDDGTLSGVSEYFIIVTQGGDSLRVQTGSIEIQADPTAATNTDFRSDTKKILDAIRATLVGNAGLDQLSYTISTSAGTRSLSRIPRTELIEMESHYLAMYRQELKKAAGKAGGRKGNVIKSKFSRRG